MPFPLLAALSIGVPLVTNVLRGRDVGEANKRNRKAIALANLQNALNPRAQHDPNLVDVHPSLLTRVAEGAGMGLSAYNAYNSLTAAAEGQRLQQEAAKQALQQGANELSKQQGEQLYARQQAIQAPEAARQVRAFSDMPEIAARPPIVDPNLLSPERLAANQQLAAQRVAPAAGALTGPASNLSRPSFLSGVSQAQMAAAQPVGGAQTVGFQAAQSAARDAARAERRQSDQDMLAKQQADRQVRAEEEARRANMAAERQRDAEMQQRAELERARLEVSRAAAAATAGDKRIEPQWFTQKAANLQMRLQTNPQLNQQNEYIDGYTAVVNGIAGNNGMGLLDAIKGLARLGSPGAVQQGEVVTQQNAAGWLSGKIGSVEGIFDGNTINEQGQKRMLELAMEKYAIARNRMDGVVDKQYSALAQGVDQEWAGPLRAYAEPYRLPSPEDLIPESTWERLQKRFPVMGGGGSVTGGSSGTDSLSALSDSLNAAYMLLGQGRR